jgi:hypothetical protein
MSGQYNLHGVVVFESDEGMGWVEWNATEDGTLTTLIGDVKIDDNIDVVVLGPPRDRTGEHRYKDIDEVRRFVSSLPAWRRTRYFNRISETGSSGLMDCESGEVVDPGFAYDLVPQLVAGYNASREESTCAICGQRHAVRIPLALFLFDRSSASLRPVCDACGAAHAAALFSLLKGTDVKGDGDNGFLMGPAD